MPNASKSPDDKQKTTLKFHNVVASFLRKVGYVLWPLAVKK